MLDWPDRIDDPLEEFMTTVGTVVRRFGERQDSRSTIVGIETEHGSFVVKHAEEDEAIGWLESALRFHAAVQHPRIAAVVHHVRTPTGLALVQEWAPGEVLVDPFDEAVPDRDDPASTYQRVLALPVARILGLLADLCDAHVAVVDAGFVAVDLYDGCLLHDATHHRLSLIDLDMYQPGPYLLDRDRQYGSSSFMAPEEWVRGATIDERTTVFTLGRFIQVLLGCARKGPARRVDFRGGDALFSVSIAACAPEPSDRVATVRELRDALG